MANEKNKGDAGEFGEVARGIAPTAIGMAVFALFYSIWFGLAWGIIGWIIFGVTVLCAIVMIAGSIKNMRHARRFPVYPTERGRKIGKSMGVLMGITYIAIFTVAAILGISGNDKFIMSAIALIIGVHFIPIGKIIDVKANYYVAPLPILSGIIGLYFGLQTDMSWMALYAVSGIGGAAATIIYGFYMNYSYKKVASIFGIQN